MQWCKIKALNNKPFLGGGGGESTDMYVASKSKNKKKYTNKVFVFVTSYHCFLLERLCDLPHPHVTIHIFNNNNNNSCNDNNNIQERGSGIRIGTISKFRGQIRTGKRRCISNFYDLNYSTTTGDDMSLIDLFYFFENMEYLSGWSHYQSTEWDPLRGSCGTERSIFSLWCYQKNKATFL